MLEYLTTSDHQLYVLCHWRRRSDCYFILLQSQPHVTTFTYNHSSHCVTFTQLTILHVPNPYSVCHTVFLTHLTSSQFLCLSPIETSLVELLLNNWLLRHSSSSYITLNHMSITVACCPVCIAATSQVRAVSCHSRKREGHVIFPCV
jgi:hypothetical protein